MKLLKCVGPRVGLTLTSSVSRGGLLWAFPPLVLTREGGEGGDGDALLSWV